MRLGRPAAPPWIRTLTRPGLTRTLGTANLCRTVGSGMLLSTTLIYLSGTLHLGTERIGLGLSAAAVVGMLASVPAGTLADRWGARTVTVLGMRLQGLAVIGYALVGGFTAFLLVACSVAAFGAASGAAAGALVADVLPPTERTSFRALMRSLGNTGLALGALGGGTALQVGGAGGARLLFVVAGCLHLASALGYRRLPEPPRGRNGRPRRQRSALRDGRLLALVGAGAALAANQSLLAVVVPLWITTGTNAPGSLYSVVLLLNSAAVIAFQVRVGRQVTGPVEAGRAMLVAGCCLALCCLLFLAAGHGPTWLVVAVLLAAALIHVTGELQHQAGMWLLSYELAPAGRHGEYQGLFQAASQLAGVVTPALGTWLITRFHETGWVVLGLLFGLPGLAVPVLVRRVRSAAADRGEVTCAA